MRKIFSIVFALAIFLSLPYSVLAGSMNLEPSAITVKTGVTFEVTVKMDSQTDPVAGVETYLVFDPTFVEHLDVTYAPLFTRTDSQLRDGLLVLNGVNEDPKLAVPFSGEFAKVTLRGIQDGKTVVYLLCTSDQHSSKILKKDASFTNVLDCNAPMSNKVANILIDSKEVLGASDNAAYQTVAQKTSPGYSAQLMVIALAVVVGSIMIGISLKKQKT